MKITVALALIAALVAIGGAEAANPSPEPPPTATFEGTACKDPIAPVVFATGTWTGATLRRIQFWAYSDLFGFLGELNAFPPIKQRAGSETVAFNLGAAATVQINFYDAKDRWTAVIQVPVVECTS